MPDQPSELSTELREIREGLAAKAKERPQRETDSDGDWEEIVPGMRIQRPKRIEPPKLPILPKIAFPDFDKQRRELQESMEEANQAIAAARQAKTDREVRTMRATEVVASELKRANENYESASRRDRWMLRLTAATVLISVAALAISLIR